MWERLLPRTVLIRRKETKAYKVHRLSDPDRTNLIADWPPVETNNRPWLDAKVLDTEHVTKQFKSVSFWEFTECFLHIPGTLKSEKALRSCSNQLYYCINQFGTLSPKYLADLFIYPILQIQTNLQSRIRERASPSTEIYLIWSRSSH